MTEEIPIKSNIPEFSVGELAFSLKRTIEDNFGRVRVRGELSRVSIAASGHMYSSIKDDQAVIDAVCWKGVMSKIDLKPEEGLEVICTGKLTTFPARSNYQLVIEDMELAGEGALLKMLEDRKKKLGAEGLFAPDRKKPIPKIPQVIGVITSPTGAVIRDILHRLRDRFPRHVLLWPALVQGQNAANQITQAIEGFQSIDQHGFPRPDVLIVARGGGSLEDLMPFNEENVVRAIAQSDIPVISAVGHETDTTLADYAADLRAPTPTGAAEMAVPVRAELLAYILEGEQRLISATNRKLGEYSHQLEAMRRGLGNPSKILDIKTQKLDYVGAHITNAYNTYTQRKEHALLSTASRIPSPKHSLSQAESHLQKWAERLENLSANITKEREGKLTHAAKMLEAYSFENVLKRGFAVIRAQDGTVIKSSKEAQKESTINIQFSGNDRIDAHISPQKTPRPAPKKRKSGARDTDQGNLF